MNEVWGCAEILPISLKRNLVVAHVIRFSFWEGKVNHMITARTEAEQAISWVDQSFSAVKFNLQSSHAYSLWPQGKLQRVNTRKIRTNAYSQQEKERYKSKFYRSI